MPSSEFCKADRDKAPIKSPSEGGKNGIEGLTDIDCEVTCAPCAFRTTSLTGPFEEKNVQNALDWTVNWRNNVPCYKKPPLPIRK